MSTKREAIYNEAVRIAGLIGNDATYEQVRTALRGISHNPFNGASGIESPAISSAVTVSLMFELEERPVRIRALVLTALLDIACEVKP